MILWTFQKTPCSTYQPPALTAVRILTSLYSSVTVSTLISEMTASLAPGMAGLYAIAAKRANQKVFTAQVLDKVSWRILKKKKGLVH